MKLLLQCSYIKDRDPIENLSLISEYIEELSIQLIQRKGYSIVTTWCRDCEYQLLDIIAQKLNFDNDRISELVSSYIPSESAHRPTYGKIFTHINHPIFSSARTEIIEYCDALITIGGGNGTTDSLDKALLTNKPIFIVYKIKGIPTRFWDLRSLGYKYQEDGDADFLKNENQSAKSYFDNMFKILDLLKAQTNSRSTSLDLRDSIEKSIRLITEGNLKAALELIGKLEIIPSGIERDFMMISSRYNRHEVDVLKGMPRNEIILDQITDAFLTFLTRLKEDHDKQPKLDNKTEDSSTKIRKILFLSANPRDQTQLRLGEELRKIKDSLAATTERDRFNLESEPAVQILTITGAMQRQRPEIVHFSGHGTGMNGIVVEDSSGRTVLFPTDGLDLLFNRFKGIVKCVVLNACFSKEQAGAISGHGIYVVGMNNAVGDKAAIDFASGFYQSLGEGKDYEFAFDMALVNNSANLRDANTPELWLNGNKLYNTL